MKVWYVDNSNYSGVFSTKQKAIKSAKNYIKQNNIKIEEMRNYKDFVEIHGICPMYNLKGEFKENEYTTIYINSYELDNDPTTLYDIFKTNLLTK